MENKKKSGSEIQKGIDRRKFIANATIATIGTIGAAGIISSCSGKPKEKLPVLLNQAPDGKVLEGRTNRMRRKRNRSSRQFS